MRTDELELISKKLEDMMEYGIGYHDAISLIAFPLIIALFAFAFPFLFTVITHINNKYNSRVISDLFTENCNYRWFWKVTKISLIFLIVYGALSLVEYKLIHTLLNKVGNWLCLFIATLYACVIFRFVKTCIAFNSPLKLIEVVEKDFKKGIKLAEKQEIDYQKKEILAKYKIWKSKAWRKYIVRGYRMGKTLPRQLVGDLYITRLIDLCKYALSRNDDTLFSNIQLRMNGVAKMEKAEKKTEWYQSGHGIKTKSASFLTNKFYKFAIDYYITCNQNLLMEERLLMNPIFSLDRSFFPSDNDLYGIMGCAYQAAIHGRISLFAKYVDYTTYGYGHIMKMPDLAYITGLDSKGQKETLVKAKEIWKRMREMLYLIAASLFVHGNYEALNTILYNKRFDNGRLYPKTGPELLMCYHRCKEWYNSNRHHEWYVKSILGENTEPELLEKYTAFRVVSLTQEEPVFMYSSEEIMIKLKSYQSILKPFAQRIKADTGILCHYPAVASKDFDNVYNGIIANMEHCADFDNRDVFCATIDIQSELAFRNSMQDMIRNRDKISIGMNGTNERGLTKKIVFGNYENCLDKTLFLEPFDYGILYSVINDYERLFCNRYKYLLYTALSEMKVNEMKMDVAEVETYLSKLVEGHEQEYQIIDTNSPFETLLMPEILTVSRYSFKGVDYFKEDIALSNLMDTPNFLRFDNSLIIIRKDNMPVLKYINDGALPKVKTEDVSNKKEGIADVKVMIEPNLQLVYNSECEIIKIEHMRMKC